MQNKIKEMFEIQDALNKSICGDNYANDNIPFYRAAIVEAVELMEHRGYKWWKKTDSYDEAQAKLEIVDIWHFLMSHIISNWDSPQNYMPTVIENFYCPTSESSKKEQLDSIDKFLSVMSSESRVAILISSFTSLMTTFNLSFDELYRMYIGKNALNYFRQENGYKEGTYNKSGWLNSEGKQSEDNVVLAEIMEGDWSTFEDVHDSLTARYPT